MIAVSGLNHKTAPLPVREACVFTKEILHDSLCELRKIHEEVAIVSTCNRTEIYYQGSSHSDTILSFLQRRLPSASGDFNRYTYTYQDTEAVRHLMRVASGLDSAALGEPQIVGQLKQAYQAAQAAGALGRALHRLFQQAFAVTKHVRTQTGIGQNPISIAYAAIQLAKQTLGDLSKRRVLLIGAGQTAALVARYLHSLQVWDLIVANRDVLKAALLTKRFGGQAVCLGSIPYHLNTADLVITATHAPNGLINRETLHAARRDFEERPLLLIDLGLPRNISPDCAQLPNVLLRALDDLQAAIAENLSERQQAAKKAETLIDIHAEAFMTLLRSLDAAAIIHAYRDNMEKRSSALLLEMQEKLKRGGDIDDTLAEFTRRLRNTLLHTPTVFMRELGKKGEWELLHTLQTCFALETSNDN